MRHVHWFSCADSCMVFAENNCRFDVQNWAVNSKVNNSILIFEWKKRQREFRFIYIFFVSFLVFSWQNTRCGSNLFQFVCRNVPAPMWWVRTSEKRTREKFSMDDEWDVRQFSVTTMGRHAFYAKDDDDEGEKNVKFEKKIERHHVNFVQTFFFSPYLMGFYGRWTYRSQSTGYVRCVLYSQRARESSFIRISLRPILTNSDFQISLLMTSLLSIDDMRHESTFAYDKEIEFNRWHMSHHIFVVQVSSPPSPQATGCL